MTCTSITTVGSVVVVTHVIPQDETSIPLQTPAAASTRPAATKTPPPSAAKVDDMTATFLRGRPHSLAVVQIFIGLLCLLFSLSAAFSQLLMVHAPFCFAIAFVLSGCLTAAAGRRPSVGLVWASLASNALSVLIGLGGAAHLCWLLADGPLSSKLCDAKGFGPAGGVDRSQCTRKLQNLDVVGVGLLSLLLVLLVLQICVSVGACVFSGKSIRRHERRSTATDCGSLLSSAASEHSSKAALLDSDNEETSTRPPNSA